MRLNFFAYPIRPESWSRPTGSRDYRVTAHYNSPDILNGGLHRAVDVGNFRQGDPVYAPGPCSAIGLRHSDGALGVRFYAPNTEVWELWHLDSVAIGSTSRTTLAAGARVGTTGNTGARLPNGSEMPAHTHIELESNGVRWDPEPYLLGKDYAWVAGEDMPRLRSVREEWDIPAGTEFWVDGPEQGERKVFTVAERKWSMAEDVSSEWRLIEYGSEVLWIRRSDLVPRSGTRNPASGYGTPSMGLTTAQVRIRERSAADAVLEAAKAAGLKYGAT